MRLPASPGGLLPAAMLLLVLLPVSPRAAVVSVDLGPADAASGMINSQRGDHTDGENDPSSCGPQEDTRQGRVNRGATDDDFPDGYVYFRIDAPAVKDARRVTITATFYDDPAFAENPARIQLQYTNNASTGPSDIANTFFTHAGSLALSGSGTWLHGFWTVEDAGFRTFMQGTSDFRFELGSARVCVDRVVVSTPAEPVDPEEYLVAAHYYPWYTTGRWNYTECNAGSLRLELLPPQRPVLGRYESSSAAVVDQHLRWCAEYGINVLILEFYRPGSAPDIVCRDVIFPHPRSSDVRFTLLYDWAIRFSSEFEVTPERIETARADFDHLAREYFPQTSYLKFRGEMPVVMIYVTRALSGDIDGLIAAIRDTCAQHGFDVFLVGDEFFIRSAPNAQRIARWDGIFGYDVYAGYGGYWGSNGKLGEFRSKTDAYRKAAQAAGVKFFPSCAPGFNDRAIRRTCADNPALSRRLTPGDTPTSLFRETFRETALKRVDDEFPLVCITSFNEWHEDTQIEPTAGKAESTAADSSPSGSQYTQGMVYDDYSLAYLEMIRDATIAVTGTIRGPAGPVAGAAIEVLDGAEAVLTRTSFTTGVYTVPRLPLQAGSSYRLRVSSPGLPEVTSAPFTVLSGRALTDFDVELVSGVPLSRGDCNADRSLDISDPVFLLLHLFLGAAPPPCLEACDANGDGGVDLSDSVYLLANLFTGGPPPVSPAFPSCEAFPGARDCPEGNCDR